MIRALAITLALMPSTGLALDLDLPGNARLVYEQVTSQDSYDMPTGPFAGGHLPYETAKGNVSRQVFRLDSQGTTTLQLFDPLREQVVSGGLMPVLECDTDQCGGFDFRFKTEVMPAPEMHVDLTDFRFLSAKRVDNGTSEYLGLLVSRSDLAGYIQLIRVSTSRIEPISFLEPDLVQKPVMPTAELPAGQALEVNGFTILTDLTFKTGSSALGDGPFASLDALALYLTANPDRKVALVGHTDTQGSLENNIALSKRRATSVLQRLVEKHGVDSGQLSAEGMGYLSPIASNLTAEGREANRRVEAVLLNIE